MKSLSYAEQLRSPHWQRKRLERLESAGWACEACGSVQRQLHVHHKQYFKGRMAWEYDGLELAVLCDDCHAYEHQEIDSMRRLMVSVSTSSSLALIAGFNVGADHIEPHEIRAARDSDAMAFAAGCVAMIAYGLPIEKMRELAAFAAALHQEKAEPRLWFVHERGDVFGDCGASDA